jgi:hypothetical protein
MQGHKSFSSHTELIQKVAYAGSSVFSSHLEQIQWMGDTGFKCFLNSPSAVPVGGSGFKRFFSHLQQIQWVGDCAAEAVFCYTAENSRHLKA